MPLGGLLPYGGNSTPPNKARTRPSPKDRQKVVSDSMSRADSLRSVHEFGSVLSPQEQAYRRANTQTVAGPMLNPFNVILNALTGKGKAKKIGNGGQ